MPDTPSPCEKTDCSLNQPAKDVCPAPPEKCGATETPADCDIDGCPVQPATDCKEPDCPVTP